jgi:NAD(P)-dependent dehydrogenase (short-subunit alcohol dehydrogenase family)
MPLKAVYAASKRFLINFSIALRQELQADGGNVLALCRGFAHQPALHPRHHHARADWPVDHCGYRHASTVRWIWRWGAELCIFRVHQPVLRVMGGVLPATVTAAFVWRRWQRTPARLRT